MTNEELKRTNEAAQVAIERGLKQISEAGAGGLNVMALAMNPGKALEQFAGPLHELLTGIEGLRRVNNELVNRVTGG